jgi:DNA-binding NarL/FixJ family response regulator
VAHQRPVVAVLNSNDDVVEMLRAAMEQSGMIVVSTHIDELKRGEVGLRDFVREHDPDVIIYDLVPPYDRGWRFFEHLRELPHMQGREYVLTSTNPKRAIELSGTSERVCEILGKPYDIQAITHAVARAAEVRGVNPRQ